MTQPSAPLPLAARQSAWAALWRVLLRPLLDDAADSESEEGSAVADQATAAAETGGDRHGGAQPLE